MTYLREFQPLRKYFQLVRTEKAFNSGELCLILASIDFVGTKVDMATLYTNLIHLPSTKTFSM